MSESELKRKNVQQGKPIMDGIINVKLKGRVESNSFKTSAIDMLNAMPIDGSYEIDIHPYKKNRLDKQRRLQYVWYTAISKHDDQETKEEVANYCKYTFGVPILSRDRDDFDKSWSAMSMTLTYEQRIDAMEFLPVTRLFKVKQNAEYLNDMKLHYEREGIMLPTKDDLYYEAMGIKK